MPLRSTLPSFKNWSLVVITWLIQVLWFWECRRIILLHICVFLLLLCCFVCLFVCFFFLQPAYPSETELSLCAHDSFWGNDLLINGLRLLLVIKPLHSYAGLRKVRDEEKTHKNKDLRKTGPVPDKPKSTPGGAPKFAAVPIKKPPKFELQGKKWIVVCIIYLLFDCKPQ